MARPLFELCQWAYLGGFQSCSVYYIYACTYNIPVAYLGLCLRGGKTGILGKKRGRKRIKRTNSHVSYQSQGGGQDRCKGGGGGECPPSPPPQIRPCIRMYGCMLYYVVTCMYSCMHVKYVVICMILASILAVPVHVV